MVKGLEKFKQYFEDFADHYILIGGAACNEHLSGAGLTFRVTKDIDIILVVEALSRDFVKRFWEFVQEGKYKSQEKSTGARKYYRFSRPENEDHPFQIELFARNPDLLDLQENAHLSPIPASDDLSSLSAILMDDDYYFFTVRNSILRNNLHIASIPGLICLKAKAFIDLKAQKDKGGHIDEKNVRKHKNDVIRLAVLLTSADSLILPETILSDMRKFKKILELEPPDYKSIGKNLGIPGLNGKEIIEQISKTFLL